MRGNHRLQLNFQNCLWSVGSLKRNRKIQKRSAEGIIAHLHHCCFQAAQGVSWMPARSRLEIRSKSTTSSEPQMLIRTLLRGSEHERGSSSGKQMDLCCTPLLLSLSELSHARIKGINEDRSRVCVRLLSTMLGENSYACSVLNFLRLFTC